MKELIRAITAEGCENAKGICISTVSESNLEKNRTIETALGEGVQVGCRVTWVVCLFVIILHSAASGHGIYSIHISSPLLP